MHRYKRDLWKAGIAIAATLLLLVLMVWVPVSGAGAQERASGLAGPGTATVQATSMIDPTMTALQKDHLILKNKQLQYQNNWLVNNSTALIAAFTTLVVALFGISQWTVNRRDERRKEKEAQDKELADRKAERERRDEEQKRWLKDKESEREKRAEERFQAVVEGLGSEREEARVGAAILLRTFIHPDHEQFYEQFYIQTFDLAVANLRLPRTTRPLEDPNSAPPLTTLSQSLIVVFKEAFPLARSQNRGDPQFLDATGIQLDNAYMKGADLRQVWMPQAFL